jgi:glycosyltransferase involved in cell wall biosynthesis
MGRTAPKESREIPERPPVVSFIVPALNEEPNLRPLLERLLAIEKELGLPSEILVIDDASGDRTYEVAREAAQRHPQIRPYRKPLPHGLGLGVRAGLERAAGKVGVVVMADGVDPLEKAVPELCHKVLREGCQLVLLSRYAEPGDAETIPAAYKVFHAVFRFFSSRVLGIPYPDTTYAFRAFDVEYLRSLNLRSTGFEISPEITFRTFFAGGRIGEVAGRQTRRVRGASKFRFTRVAARYAWVGVQGLLLRLGLARAALLEDAAGR